MTRAEALAEGRKALASSSTAALDASLLLAWALGLGREALYLDPEREVDAEALDRFGKAIDRRSAGRPVAYLTGVKEFYGRPFAVGEGVLVPRPDTELLVELALSLGDRLTASAAGRPLRVHECCTGSGAVAVSVAAERPAWEVSASDLSDAALEIASGNASSLLDPGRPGGPVAFFRADLLSAAESVPERTQASSSGAAARGPYDLVLANPPYVESKLARELVREWGEPLLALDGGEDGLDLVRRLLPEALPRLAPKGLLLVEADGSQAAEIRGLFSRLGFTGVRSERDLAGIERVTLGAAP